jgi:hypothetical protein
MKPEMNVLGIDLAKRAFHTMGMDDRGNVVYRKRTATAASPRVPQRVRRPSPTRTPPIWHSITRGCRAPGRKWRDCDGAKKKRR